ncbi:phosphopantetheine-binding protein, partial [uncultured Shewanella sp.]|uniref:phosphopantetheine-binding protein n=1 Tax=uncultured Shewanella sp. TaxID=173975 RepID=UPI0026319EAF
EAKSASTPEPAPVESLKPDRPDQDLQALMLAVVAEKTGYPTEMLALDMDMEADLGIDSIKRVEILGTVQTQATALPELNPEEMAECRTLGDIVSYLNSQLESQPHHLKQEEPTEEVVSMASLVEDIKDDTHLALELEAKSASTPEPAPAESLKPDRPAQDLQALMLAVVAEKTGYPTEMLALDMDMEADLGIDSIKRVEILGTVQTQATALPELNPEEMAECRTLGDIVSYLNSQ